MQRFLFACAGNYSTSGSLVPRTVDEDPLLPQISLKDGARVHLEVFGEAKQQAIIILHGGPGGSYKPYLPLKSLSDSYKMVFLIKEVLVCQNAYRAINLQGTNT